MLECKHSLPDPGKAGALSWEALRQWAKQYPSLRPCPRVNWNWTYRSRCEKCPDAIRKGEK